MWVCTCSYRHQISDCFSRGCRPGDLLTNFRSLTAFAGPLSASSAIICFFSARRFRCFCESLIRFLSFCFTTFNLFLEFCSSFLFSGVVKPESFNEVNDAILDSNWFISLLARSWDVVSYCFESFSGGVKAGGSFDFELAVKACCCSAQHLISTY